MRGRGSIIRTSKLEKRSAKMEAHLQKRRRGKQRVKMKWMKGRTQKMRRIITTQST